VALHAKVYLSEAGKQTHLVIGSANATNAGFIAGSNVELMVELIGPRKYSRVRDFLDSSEEGGFGSLLLPWLRAVDNPARDKFRELERLLEAGKREFAAAELQLNCESGGDSVSLELSSAAPPSLDGIDEARAWPVTLGSERSVDCMPLVNGTVVSLPVQSLASVTGLIAFELTASRQRLAFVLNLPVEGLPEDRGRIILRHVVNNREGFLRYLLLLLAGLGDGAEVGDLARVLGSVNGKERSALQDDMPLLEEMVRAYSRDPQRLVKVKRLVEDLTEGVGADDILPEGFEKLWAVFEEAMDGR